jgi:hypothetical protein
MNIIDKLKKKLKFPWYIRYGNSYFDIWIENPLHTWWKARKYFKFPKVSFHPFFSIKRNCSYFSYNNVGKILEIDFHDIGWKDKWNSPRHEKSPYVWVCLFKTIGFSINFDIYYYNEFGEKVNGDMHYWEYLLNWLYYKNKKTLRCYSAWTSNSELYRYVEKWGNEEDGSKDEYKPYQMIIPEVAMSLNKEGIKELKKQLNEQGRNN